MIPFLEPCWSAVAACTGFLWTALLAWLGWPERPHTVRPSTYYVYDDEQTYFEPDWTSPDLGGGDE